ncbi:hypothetical protein HAX54_043582 [Datura stramonium]|uniref:S1-like domain-containing protein n=1 Tax=Datura stramonium TaxID=4076 RepID=A0ABS8SNB8_DATST|nr:hypothetical protein [Datura stramonium]
MSCRKLRRFWHVMTLIMILHPSLCLRLYFIKLRLLIVSEPKLQKNRRPSTSRRFVERAYKYRPVKVVDFELPRQQCVVYLDLKREECANPSFRRVYSQAFHLGGQARTKPGEEYVSKYKGNYTSRGKAVGYRNLFAIPWTSFIARTVHILLMERLHLRAETYYQELIPVSMDTVVFASWGIHQRERKAKPIKQSCRKKMEREKKNRKRGKNEADDEKRELVFKEDGQEYAQVLRMLGNGRCEAMCIDGTKRLVTYDTIDDQHNQLNLYRKFYNQLLIKNVITVPISASECSSFVVGSSDDKADVILKKALDEARLLKAYGELAREY